MDYEKEMRELVAENDKLRKKYQSLVKELSDMKDMEIKAVYGNKLKYKIAKWLIKKKKKRKVGSRFDTCCL